MNVFRSVRPACVAFLMICWSTSFSQLREQSLVNRDQISIPSPNISSLGLFGEVPVSYFTGLPEISIPLYTYTDGSISIPITLSYHAGGFRPDVHPGWTGAGWNLSASSWAVTRKVNGKPDDYNTKPNEDSTSITNPVDPYGSLSGYYFNRKELDQNRWNQVSYLNELTGTDVNKRIIGTRRDTEPDEYSFSFPGGSGKFYLDMDGTWKVDCDRAVKVELRMPFLKVPFNTIQGHSSVLQNFGYCKTFAGFTITDIDGTKYIYGGSANYIEYSMDFMEQGNDFWQADSWFLKEIVDRVGRIVSFEYERFSYINQLMMSVEQNFGTGAQSSGFWQAPCGLSAGSTRVDYPGRLIYPLYLKRILGRMGSIVFKSDHSTELDFGKDEYTSGTSTPEGDIYATVWDRFYFDGTRLSNEAIFPRLKEWYTQLPDPKSPAPVNHRSLAYAYFYLTMMQWKKLDIIEVWSPIKKVKTFKFDYESERKRLTLSAVSEGNINGTDYNSPYAFTYNPVDVVPYFAAKVDHWGFYNGVDANFAQLNTNPSLYYNSRSPDANFAKQSVLQRITYPTGGYTEFEFEGHYAELAVPLDRSASPVTFHANVGGLRLRKISNVNVFDRQVNGVREFFYVKDYKNTAALSSLVSSGVLGGQTQYLFADFRVPTTGGQVYFKKNQFSSLSQLPASNNSRGSHIGYSEVVEKRSDGSYTIYYYSNFDNGFKDEASPTTNLATSPYGPFTSLERERGNLYKMEMRDKHDAPVYRKETLFQPQNKITQFVESIRARDYQICPGTNYRYTEATAYKNYIYAVLPERVTETNFSAGVAARVTIKAYSYNSYKLVNEETFTNSDNKVHVYRSYYPFNYSGTAPYGDMVQKNIIQPIIQQDFLINNVVQDVYRTEYTNDRSPNPNLSLPASLSVKHGDNNSEIRIQYHKYDDRGNVLSYSKDNGVLTHYVWGYAKTYPVAVVKNTDYATVEAVLGGEWYLGLVSNATDGPGGYSKMLSDNIFIPLRTDARLSRAHVTTYEYDLLVGQVSSTDLNSRTTYYGYDLFGRLSSIKDNNQHFLRKYDYVYWKK